MADLHPAEKQAARTASCWCWQYGRCLVLTECPTAAHPKPKPFTDAAWKREAERLMADFGRSVA